MTTDANQATHWKETPPDVVVEAAGQTAIALPEDFPLSNSQFARLGDDLLIRSIDGIVISVRGYYATPNRPKLVEHNAPPTTPGEAEVFAREYLDIEEELAEEEITEEQLAEEQPGEEQIAEESSDEIAQFVTRAGNSDENPGITDDPAAVIDRDYTDPFENAPSVTAIRMPAPDGVATTDPAPIHADNRHRIVAETDTSEPVPAVVEAAHASTPEPVQPVAPEPVPEPEPEPDPVATPSEPEGNTTPVEDKVKSKGKGKEDDSDDKAKSKGKDKDDDEDDKGKSSGKDKEEDADGDAENMEFTPVDETSDETYVFHQGDGKLKITDFDLGDVLRLEGFSGDDILIKSKGDKVEVSIVGDKKDKITLDDPLDSNTDSYSISHADDGTVIITLDSD